MCRPRRRFQSTCPLRGTTTRWTSRDTRNLLFQSTCPLRGTTNKRRAEQDKEAISIHVPLAGHDSKGWENEYEIENFNPRAPCGARRTTAMTLEPSAAKFQSTCPLRGTTMTSSTPLYINPISIHVPLAGHDGTGSRAGSNQWNFNPRAPCGARHYSGGETMPQSRAFQSTCPLRGTTRT